MTSQNRKSWDLYFLELAAQVATRGTCDRKQVGCVIVAPNKRIVSTGYNGSIPGAEHCDTAGHLIVNGTCIRTIHAEQNALLNVVVPKGSTAYVTMEPCATCFKLLISSGVTRVVFSEPYRDGCSLYVKELGLEVFGVSADPSTTQQPYAVIEIDV